MEHEKTCDGTFDLDSAPIMTLHKGQTERDSGSEEYKPREGEWWRSFADRAEKSDLDIKAIEHGGKIVLLLQIIGTRELVWFNNFHLYR